MEEYAVHTIIMAVIFWTSLYFLVRKLLPNRSYEFCNRVVSTVHATLAVILACICLQQWSCPFCQVATLSTPYQMKTLGITMGYFIYDLICSQFDKNTGFDHLVHHVTCIVGLTAGLTYQQCGAEMVAALLITEISTPLLNLREFLKELGYKDTPLSLAADILFAVVFSVARMIGGPYLSFFALSAEIPLIMKAMTLGLQLVSVFWFYKILRMVKYKLFRHTSLRKTTTVSSYKN